LASKGAEIELQGSSDKGFEEAVQTAIMAASDVQTIESAEFKTLRVDISGGRVRTWSVKLTARL
jgi:flavin-binding protein dodecin